MEYGELMKKAEANEKARAPWRDIGEEPRQTSLAASTSGILNATGLHYE